MTQAEIKVFYNKTTQASGAVQKDAALAASCVLCLILTFVVRFRMMLPLKLGTVSFSVKLIHVFFMFPSCCSATKSKFSVEFLSRGSS